MKKTLTKQDVEKLARLSSLALSDSELKKIEGQFSETLDYVENLNELDVSKVDECSSVSRQKNKFFDDGLKNERLLNQSEATSNSTNAKNNLFVVPKVLSK